MRIPTRSAWQTQRDVIYALLLREIQSRFGKSRVGFLWALFEPMAHIAVPVILFGFILSRVAPAGYAYPVYLLHGLVPFLMFKNVCMQTMEGGGGSRGLLAYRQVQLIDLFLARALAVGTMQLVLVAPIFIGLAIFDYPPWPYRPVEEFLIWVVAMIFGLGLGMVFAAICGFVPDARAVIRVSFMPAYLLSGVIFPITRFPNDVVQWLLYNPCVHLVELARSFAFRDFQTIEGVDPLYLGAVTLVALFLGLCLYRLRKLTKVTA